MCAYRNFLCQNKVSPYRPLYFNASGVKGEICHNTKFYTHDVLLTACWPPCRIDAKRLVFVRSLVHLFFSVLCLVGSSISEMSR